MSEEFTNVKKVKYPELMPLWIGLFVDILGFYVIIPFLATFIVVFETTPLVIGLVLATNAMFTLVSAPIWGRLSDRFGRKPILIISQLGTFSAFLMLAFTDSIEMLFLARMVDGIFGGNFPMVKAIISDQVPPKDRSLQMTNIGVAHVLAGLVGPGLGGILSLIRILGSEYPVATVGLAAAGLSFTSLLITIFFVRESWPKDRRMKMEKVIKTKVKIRKNKDATYLLTLYTFHTFSFIMYISTMVIYIGYILGLGTLEIGLLLTISGLFRAIVRFSLFKPTLRLLGEKNMTRLGLFILVLTFFVAGFVQDVFMLLILMLIVSYGVSCSRGLLISKITQSVTPKEQGKINGITTTLDSFAMIGGPIIGALLLTIYSPHWWGIVMGLIALMAFLMVFKKIIPLHLKEQQLQIRR
ncbi:MAG: MFS transporter [Candidatus Hodarchaeota archaeon]